jgi:hypothetical protein
MRLGRLAAVSLLATALATAAASPALAAKPSPPAAPKATKATTGAGVPGDLDGDGTPDVVTGVGNYLSVFPTNAPAFAASNQLATPDSTMSWGNYGITHRGSLTGSKTDDLLLLNPTSHHVYVYPNDADFGGTPGHFTHKDQVLTVAKPSTCAAGTDCTGYDPTWNSTTQILATDGNNGVNTQPALITVEAGKLWYYPAAQSGAAFGNPVLLGTGDWSGTNLAAPGKINNVPTLWARGTAEVGAVASFPLTFKADGTPTALLNSPTAQQWQSGLIQTDGTHLCLAGDMSGAVTGQVPLTLAACSATDPIQRWQLGSDGTVHAWGNCLDSATAALSPCDGRDSERHWQAGTYNSLVDSVSGRCFGFPAAVFPNSRPLMATCDVSAGQRFGSAGGATPGPLPAAVDLLPGAFYQMSASGGPITSVGDIDRTGYPGLLWDNHTQLYDYPGLGPVNGVPRLSVSRHPLGSDVPYITTAPDYTNPLEGLPGAVTYGPCAKLTMQEGGNLVYSDYQGNVFWQSNTAGHPGGSANWDATQGLVLTDGSGQTYWTAGPSTVHGAQLALTPDCNLLIEDSNGKVLWSAGTYEPSHDPYGYGIVPGTTLHAGDSQPGTGIRLQVTADGDLEQVGADGTLLWALGTGGHPGAYATLQTDGNLVLCAADGSSLWSSNTGGNPGDHLTVQNDGNLVIRDSTDSPIWSRGTSGTAVAVGTVLTSGQTLQSQRAKLTMQADGNLVVYSTATGHPLWSAQTNGHSGATATMQADGNLVIHDAGGTALWSTNSSNHPGARAVLLDTADLAVVDGSGNQLWHSGSDVTGPLYRGSVISSGDQLASGAVLNNAQHSGAKLTMQTDGNLVLYGAGGALWSAQTNNHPGATATMQTDGNLVIHDASGTALWSPMTNNHPGAYAVYQYDDNFVIYDADGIALWSTNTSGKY